MLLSNLKGADMNKNRRFILFSSEGGKVVVSESMDLEEMLQELFRREIKQVTVAAGWMREANRCDYYLTDGLVILCVSGKRALSGGKISSIFAYLKDQPVGSK
jgi:hypothetical protein